MVHVHIMVDVHLLHTGHVVILKQVDNVNLVLIFVMDQVNLVMLDGVLTVVMDLMKANNVVVAQMVVTTQAQTVLTFMTVTAHGMVML